MTNGPYAGTRQIVYDVVAMGALATRLLVEKGAVVVGAIGAIERSPTKVGRDLVDVAGLG